MKVYCIMEDAGYDGIFLCRIYAKEEDAEKYLEENQKTDMFGEPRFEIREEELR